MAFKFNNIDIPMTGVVKINSNSCNYVKYNNTQVWRKSYQIYPGKGIANAVNSSDYQPYWTYSDNGSTIHVESFGGTNYGKGFVAIGPFSSIGYSQCYFHNAAVNVLVNNSVLAEVGIGDINGNFTQRFFYTNGGIVYGTGSVFNINSANGNYYLIIKTEAGADYSGHKVTVDLTGFTLI